MIYSSMSAVTYHHKNIKWLHSLEGQAKAQDYQGQSHDQYPHQRLNERLKGCDDKKISCSSEQRPDGDWLVELEMFGSRMRVMTTPYEVNLMQIND